MSSNTAIKEALRQLARQDDDIARALTPMATRAIEAWRKVLRALQR